MLTVKDGPGFYRGSYIPGGNIATRRGADKLAPVSPLQRAKPSKKPSPSIRPRPKN
jgi:hypothetical protein